jgi:brefeldin A-resistance guanine nucleotide exchange factor 1
MVTSPDFWVILRTLAQRPDVSPIVFSILEEVTVGQLSIAVLADNYEPAVALLNDYASAGSVGAASEQAQDRKSKRGAPAKPPKAKYVYYLGE